MKPTFQCSEVKCSRLDDVIQKKKKTFFMWCTKRLSNDSAGRDSVGLKKKSIRDNRDKDFHEGDKNDKKLSSESVHIWHRSDNSKVKKALNILLNYFFGIICKQYYFHCDYRNDIPRGAFNSVSRSSSDKSHSLSQNRMK